MASYEDFSLKETTPNISSRTISRGPVSSFNLVEHMQFLYVRIVKARELPLPCDPFVELKLGNYIGTTVAIQKNPNPVWNQVFAFSKDRIQDVTMGISVKDKAAVVEGLGHPTVGKFCFVVNEVPTKVPPDSALAPEGHRIEGMNGVKIRGELMLSYWFGTQADEAFSEAFHADVAGVSGEYVNATRSKGYLSPRLWYLRVNVIEAQDLILRNINNVEASEIVVRIRLGNLFFSTRASRNRGINPAWNEDIMYVTAEPFDDHLFVSVMEIVNKKEEHWLGTCEVPLSGVVRRVDAIPVPNHWYDLSMMVENHLKDLKFASRIHTRISLDGGYHVIDEPTNNISDLQPSSRLLWTPPIGVLEIGILNARGLSPLQNSKPNPNQVWAYCVAKYGNKWVRTRTIVDSLEPKWNEQYTWEVYDPCTVISVGVFNNVCSNKQRDVCLGKIRIRLSTLETDRVRLHEFLSARGSNAFWKENG